MQEKIAFDLNFKEIMKETRTSAIQEMKQKYEKATSEQGQGNISDDSGGFSD